MRDALGREIVLARAPRTIVSLVPSDTYSLVRLGAADRIVGRTKYCVEPASIIERIRTVGGTKDADVAAVIETSPDLVIANQEENSRRDLERLAQAGLAVYVSFPKTVSEGLAHLARLARLLDVASEPAVKELLSSHYETLREAASSSRERRVRTFFPIWLDPLMTIHRDTFISDMIELAGGTNVFADRERRYPLAADLGQGAPLTGERVRDRDVRYPRVTWDEVVRRAPELVLLPDEPYAFTSADAEKFRALDIPASQSGAIRRVDGKDFSWYGAKSLEAIPRARRLVALDRAIE